MKHDIRRRDLLGHSAAAAVAATLGGPAGRASVAEDSAVQDAPLSAPRRYRLGLVTYNLVFDWELGALIDGCREIGLGALELRSTHKHGVEPSLAAERRREIRKRFEGAGVVLLGLGSACEFHSPDKAEVARNIDLARAFIDLAADLGARQVKVRPNGLPEGVEESRTLAQIGESLRALGEAAGPAGVEIVCEVHGRQTQEPPRMRRIMEIAAHPAVGVTWNSNPTDVQGGSVREAFELLRRWILNVHINELVSSYPWRELFALLNESGYDRWTMIEAQALKSREPEDTLRFLRFYRALWEELSRPV